MDFKDYLKDSAEQINATLDQIFASWRKEVAKINPHVLRLLEVSIQASEGGKRLRGTLVKLGYELAGGKKDNQDILVPAAAYEIFQTAILAHDDIIDKSPLRRGKETIYQTLGADHHAISQTICLGDIGFFLSYQLISQSNFPDQNKNKAIKAFSKTMIDTAFGEILDVELPYLNTKYSEKDVITISKYKTAWYTIVGPLQLGAALAGADQKLLDNLKIFGENLGIAFQIQDDILGIFGSEAELGKSVTSDVEEGKATLLYLEALKQADQSQKEILEKYYGQGQINNDQLSMIKEVFEQTGALKYAQNLAQDYVAKAKKVIPDLTISPISTDSTDFTALLTQMADFLINRSK